MRILSRCRKCGCWFLHGVFGFGLCWRCSPQVWWDAKGRHELMIDDTKEPGGDREPT